MASSPLFDRSALHHTHRTRWDGRFHCCPNLISRGRGSIDHRSYPLFSRPIRIANFHAVTRTVLNQPKWRVIGWLTATTYASFTNLPASTRLQAHSFDDGRANAGGVGRSRLTALLSVAAGTEFLLVAGAAYFAAVLYHRVVLLEAPDSARYILESLLHIGIAGFGIPRRWGCQSTGIRAS